MCPSWMLRRGMESAVAGLDSRSQGHHERLNGTIEVLVIERILIVPYTGGRVGDLITHEPNTVVAVIRFDLIHCRASPGHNRWLLTHGAAHRTKTKRLIDSIN